MLRTATASDQSGSKWYSSGARTFGACGVVESNPGCGEGDKYVWKQKNILKSSAVVGDRCSRQKNEAEEAEIPGASLALVARTFVLKPHILLQTHYHTLLNHISKMTLTFLSFFIKAAIMFAVRCSSSEINKLATDFKKDCLPREIYPLPPAIHPLPHPKRSDQREDYPPRGVDR
jgi:hypothetical protein